MKKTAISLSCSVMILIGFIVSPGCLSPDRWAVFSEPTALDRIAGKNDFKDLPPLHRPRTAQIPKIEDFPSQDPAQLSIEETVFLVLSRNRDLKIQQLAPAIAGTFEEIERGRFDPELFTGISAGRQTESKHSTDEKIEAAAGIRQALPSGAVVETLLSQSKDTAESSGEKHHTRLGLSVTQALLKGAGPLVNLARIRQRELDTAASVYELQGFCQALVAQTEIAYWNYVLALKEIDIYQSARDVAVQQKTNIEEQILVGRLPENEAAAGRAEVAIREQALINARNILEERRLKLLQLINVDAPQNFDITIDAVSDPVMDFLAVTDLADRVALALASRPDLHEARLRMQQGRLAVRVTRNGLLPELDLFMDLGINGYGRRMTASVPDISDDAYDVTVGLRLSRAAANRTAQAEHRFSVLTATRAGAAIENLEYRIRYDVSLAVNEVERNRRQIHASKITRLYAEQTLKAEQERFNVGVGTAFMVARAQRDLLESRIALIKSIINYRIALVRLYLAEGSLLLRRGVTIAVDTG